MSDISAITGQSSSTSGATALAGIKTAVTNLNTDKLESSAVTAIAQAAAAAATPDSSTTVKGLTKLSVAPVTSTSPIAVGQNDPVVPTQGENDALVGNNTSISVGSGNKFVTQTGLQNTAETYATSTGSANAYVLTLSPVPTAYVAGQEFEFKANFANTGAATLNVGSLGAVAIKKADGATALASGDIANGQIAKVKYDGTNFQLLSPTGNLSLSIPKNGTASVSPSGTPTTIAHGLGAVPRIVTLDMMFVNAFGTYLQSRGSFTAGSQALSYFAEKGSSATSPVSGSGTAYAVLYGPTGNGSINSNNWSGFVSVDATNITITWTSTGSPGTPTFPLMWTAIA